MVYIQGGVPYAKMLHNPQKCLQCCGSGSGIRCLFDPWIREPERVKNRDPDPGWTSQIINSESFKTIFGLKILKYFDADPESFQPGIRDRKIRNRVSRKNIPDPQRCKNVRNSQSICCSESVPSETECTQYLNFLIRIRNLFDPGYGINIPDPQHCKKCPGTPFWNPILASHCWQNGDCFSCGPTCSRWRCRCTAAASYRRRWSPYPSTNRSSSSRSVLSPVQPTVMWIRIRSDPKLS